MKLPSLSSLACATLPIPVFFQQMCTWTGDKILQRDTNGNVKGISMWVPISVAAVAGGATIIGLGTSVHKLRKQKKNLEEQIANSRMEVSTSKGTKERVQELLSELADVEAKLKEAIQQKADAVKEAETSRKEAHEARTHFVTMGSAFAREYGSNVDFVAQDILKRAEERRDYVRRPDLIHHQ